MKNLTQFNLKRYFYINKVVKKLDDAKKELNTMIKDALQGGEFQESGNMVALVKSSERSGSLSKNTVIGMFSDVMSKDEIENRISLLPKTTVYTLNVSPLSGESMMLVEIDDYCYEVLGAIPDSKISKGETIMLVEMAIDDMYKSEIVETGMEDLIEETEIEWKRDKFDELLYRAKQQNGKINKVD